MRTSSLLASSLALALVACTSTAPSSSSSSSSSAVSTASSVAATTPFTLNDPRVQIFATDLSGARVMVKDSFGGIWVSRPKAGIVTLLQTNESGAVSASMDIFRGLKNPHGLALNNSGTILYIAEETSIKKALLYSDAPVETIATLPPGGRHFTRTIAFGPDGRLYVSIGSTCDSCIEKNPLNGSIISMNADGTDQKTVATGLRNTVFFDWSYVDGAMYGTDMGRDTLGDVTPPDEVNRIVEGKNYGWPYCYGDKIRDENISKEYDCTITEPPHIALPAHVAPLGMAFIPEEGWPEEWWYDLLIAEHGSWNSSEKVGYKIVRIPLDAYGNPEGAPVDFMTGFLDGSTVNGRPVDLMIEPGGTLYISDDQNGVIYKVNAGVEM